MSLKFQTMIERCLYSFPPFLHYNKCSITYAALFLALNFAVLLDLICTSVVLLRVAKNKTISSKPFLCYSYHRSGNADDGKWQVPSHEVETVA